MSVLSFKRTCCTRSNGEIADRSFSDWLYISASHRNREADPKVRILKPFKKALRSVESMLPQTVRPIPSCTEMYYQQFLVGQQRPYPDHTHVSLSSQVVSPIVFMPIQSRECFRREEVGPSCYLCIAGVPEISQKRQLFRGRCDLLDGY